MQHPWISLLEGVLLSDMICFLPGGAEGDDAAAFLNVLKMLGRICRQYKIGIATFGT